MTGMEWVAFGIGAGNMMAFAALFWKISSH